MKPIQPKVIVTLVRHGETYMNVQRVMQGHSDTPLSLIGIEQAKKLGQHINTKFTRAYSSDLQRANNTANLILAEVPVETPTVIKDILLRERGFGDAEGKPYREFAERAAKANKSVSDFVPNGAESPEDLRNRAANFFDKLCNMTRSVTEDENILIVSHGGWIQALMRHLKESTSKFSLKNFSPSEAIRIHDNTAVTVMQISPLSLPQETDLIVYEVDFIKINNIDHLKQRLD